MPNCIFNRNVSSRCFHWRRGRPWKNPSTKTQRKQIAYNVIVRGCPFPSLSCCRDRSIRFSSFANVITLPIPLIFLTLISGAIIIQLASILTPLCMLSDYSINLKCYFILYSSVNAEFPFHSQSLWSSNAHFCQGSHRHCICRWHKR